MRRRDFIRRISYTGAGAMVLGGIPVNAMKANGLFQLAAASSTNDKVLVFIQLHGGNDALNTIVPVSQYDTYYNLRPNLALLQSGDRGFKELDATLGDDYRVGVHPEMIAMKQMYDQGKVAVVQNVGYPDMNLSHFRGRDIVFMGGDAQSDYESGWMGRFLDFTYPGYPDAYPNDSMPDPLGIELSGTQSLAFHTETGIPNGLSFNSPEGFFELINSTGNYQTQPPLLYPDSHAGDELRYLMEFEAKNNQYAPRLKEVYDAGSNSPGVDYPDAYPRKAPQANLNNPLSPQLKLIARMLKGGIKTKIFLCRIGGFDTHGAQVEKGEPSVGLHAALLYHLSEAVKAFYDDLKDLGIDQKVLSMTFTEFGRRAYSNDSYGTDHGTSTPVLLFGTGLNAGIHGVNPDLSDLSNGNLKYNIDYRQIYTSVVQDWFGASDEAMVATGFDDWVGQKIDLIGTTGIKDTLEGWEKNKILIYPNPVSTNFNVEFFLLKPDAFTLIVFNVEGKQILKRENSGFYGNNKVELSAAELNTGKYIVQVRAGKEIFTSSFIKR
jgi:uncharacterized protein (DUF1501 family)